MNSLNRDIKEGEIVVLRADYFKPKYKALEYRLFVVQGGFGMSAHTSGTKISGYFLEDHEETMWSALEIDPEETNKYQKNIQGKVT